MYRSMVSYVEQLMKISCPHMYTWTFDSADFLDILYSSDLPHPSVRLFVEISNQTGLTLNSTHFYAKHEVQPVCEALHSLLCALCWQRRLLTRIKNRSVRILLQKQFNKTLLAFGMEK